MGAFASPIIVVPVGLIREQGLGVARQNQLTEAVIPILPKLEASFTGADPQRGAIEGRSASGPSGGRLARSASRKRLVARCHLGSDYWAVNVTGLLVALAPFTVVDAVAE
jgi:hypothetical protein